MNEKEKYTSEIHKESHVSEVLSDQSDTTLAVTEAGQAQHEPTNGEIESLPLDDLVPRSWKSWE